MAGAGGLKQTVATFSKKIFFSPQSKSLVTPTVATFFNFNFKYRFFFIY